MAKNTVQKDHFKNLVESAKLDCGENLGKAGALAGERVEDLLTEGKLQAEDISLKALFDATVDQETIDTNDAAQVAEGINKSMFPVISSKIINSQIIAAYNLAEGDVSKLYRTIPATRTDEETIVGFASGNYTPLLRPEGMSYEETSFGEKYWNVKMADFGRMISVTRETIFEDRTGEVMERARDIGEAAGQHKAKMVIQTLECLPRTAFNEVTGASNAAIYKGSAKQQTTFYSNTHAATIDSAGVNDNLSTLALGSASAALNAVKGAWQQMQEMVDEAGQKISIPGPYYMVVDPSTYVDVWNAFNTPSWMPTGGEGQGPTGSPLGAMAPISIIQSLWLTAGTWYFGRPDQQLRWVEVFPAATASQGTNAELAFTNQIVARYRFNYHGGIGNTDYRYVIGKIS